MSVFADLVGQGDVVASLEAAVRGEGMTHAWLFTGPPGSGRSIAARAFAAALLCRSGGCAECESCRQVRNGSHANLVVVTPAGLSISVDEARRVVRQAALASSGGGTHVVVVEDADRLTEQAANAWLKAIEEPEPGCEFLLCAPGADDLPPTIRSRCRLVTLRLPTAPDVAATLVAAGAEPSLAAWAARAAQGHVGRARGLATDPVARTQREQVLALPGSVSSVGACLAAAATLVAAADEEADRRTTALATAESAAFEDSVGKGRGTAGLYADLAKRQKSRETRARRDSLDRALVDLVAWYRDVLSVQLRTGAELVHDDQSVAIRAAAGASAPEVTLRRIEAVLACREAIAANVTPLLAVEQLTLALRPD
jgi:DNA polymerase-3 subunit delta'